jgi:hypothetical protein
MRHSPHQKIDDGENLNGLRHASRVKQNAPVFEQMRGGAASLALHAHRAGAAIGIMRNHDNHGAFVDALLHKDAYFCPRNTVVDLQ